jgi:ribulose-phosphate 3-epimerase
MGVNPGFGGQKFIPYVLDKVRALKKMIDERGLNVDIELDGGVNINNVEEIIQAGVNVVVAGSAVFNGNTGETVKAFMEILNKYE